MPPDPLNIVAEILGEPAATMTNPVNAGYQCPFINSECVKRSQRSTSPYPLCTIWHGTGAKRRMMCMCPKRLFEADIINDVIKHCWIGTPPQGQKVAYDVKIKDAGMVDLVIADVDLVGNVQNFVSVAMHAVDCSGSVEPAYNAIVSNVALLKSPGYGINWANVRKRYIHKLIVQGFFHHHWQSRIVSVIQTPLYDFLQSKMGFTELPTTSTDANVAFMVYKYESAPDKGAAAHRLVFDRVVGASYNSLLMSSLYLTPPSRATITDSIKKLLSKFD